MVSLDVLNLSPDKGKEVFIADTARLIGRVKLGEHASVWFGAVLRGDGDQITVGKGSNIQDNAVVHVDPGFPVTIGENCIIGHGAVIHGAELSHHVLVGIHATVLNGAKIGEYSIIAAGALVAEGVEIPPYSLVMGVPGKVVKTIGPELKEKIIKNAASYQALSLVYLEKDGR